MPAPAAVYVIAVVGGVAAAVAFKEFVYDPHIAPAFQSWQSQFNASRARRRQRRGVASVVSEQVSASGTELRSLVRPNNRGDDDVQNATSNELENMVAREVDEWRNVVERSNSGLRHRNVGGSSTNVLEDSDTFVPYNPMSPTHVMFDFSNETSPTSVHHPGYGEGSASAFRVAGPPTVSSVPGSPISSVLSNSIHPSDSVSVAGRATPHQMSPPNQARSLSFTYDARAMSLSPPVMVFPTLPTPSLSPALSGRDSIVRPSLSTQGLGLDLFPEDRPETPLSSGSYDFASPRNLSASPAFVRNSSHTQSDADRTEFFSDAGQSPERSTLNSVRGRLGGEGVDHWSRSVRSATPSDFSLGDESDGGSWASVSQTRR